MQLHPKVAESRHLGVIYALDLKIQMDRYGKKRNAIYKEFMDRGIFLRPLGNTIYIMPPYIIEEDQLNEIYRKIEEVLKLL
jgi:adenosylmethionine-8-amino-7-oxononanoate aminotransferase